MAKSAMNAINLLKADHRLVEELFEKYEKARGRKATIAQQICQELIVHALLEEEIFYPACRVAGVESDLMDEASVEHDGAKVLLMEIQKGTPEDEFFDAKVSVLSEQIKHHVKEEEKRDGVMAQAKRNGVDLDQLGEQMAARKKELLAQIKQSGLPKPSLQTMTLPMGGREASA